MDLAQSGRAGAGGAFITDIDGGGGADFDDDGDDDEASPTIVICFASEGG